jgi:hypothetical protein
MERGAPPITLFEPATYAIRVRGGLDPAWSDRLGGMRITVIPAGNRTITQLTGRLSDQAALIGVLNALYGLGMPLLSVEHMPP